MQCIALYTFYYILFITTTHYTYDKIVPHCIVVHCISLLFRSEFKILSCPFVTLSCHSHLKHTSCQQFNYCYKSVLLAIWLIFDCTCCNHGNSKPYTALTVELRSHGENNPRFSQGCSLHMPRISFFLTCPLSLV